MVINFHKNLLTISPERILGYSFTIWEYFSVNILVVGLQICYESPLKLFLFRSYFGKEKKVKLFD